MELRGDFIQLVLGKFFVITVLVMHESLALHLQAVGVCCQIQFLGPRMCPVVNSVKPLAQKVPEAQITLWQGCVCTPVIWRWCDWPPLPQAVKILVTQQECQIILSPPHPPPPPPSPVVSWLVPPVGESHL